MTNKTEASKVIRDAQKYANYLPEGVRLSEATLPQLRQAIRDGRDAESPHRPLYEIAADIKAHWPKPYFAAVPYISAMSHLDRVTADFGADSADSIVRRFLANAAYWRGPDAGRIKAELRGMLK